MRLANHRLLPPQTTPLERAIADSAPQWDALANTLEVHTSHNAQQPPAAFAPWLAAEWGLAQFAPYFDGVEALIASGLPWLLERGSAASLRTALQWLGYEQATVSEEGPYLQLDVGRIISAAALAELRAVVLASIPAHVHFYRITSGYDDRAIRLSAGPMLGAGLLNRHSGVLLDGTDVWQSYGVNTQDSLAAHDPAAFDCTETMWSAVQVRRPDHMVLGAWRLNTGGLPALRESAQAWDHDDCPAFVKQGLPDQAVGELNFDSIHRAPAQPCESAVYTQGDTLPARTPKRTWTGAWAGAWMPTFGMTESTQH